MWTSGSAPAGLATAPGAVAPGAVTTALEAGSSRPPFARCHASSLEGGGGDCFTRMCWTFSGKNNTATRAHTVSTNAAYRTALRMRVCDGAGDTLKISVFSLKSLLLGGSEAGR